jgi:hypothetical protein
MSTAPLSYPPAGRTLATLPTIESQFVSDAQYAASLTRQALWGEWQAAVQILRSVVPIAAVWLSGSFISSKLDPEDVDTVFWVRDDLLEAARLKDPRSANVVAAFSQGRGVLEGATGLRVDSYLCAWRPNPSPMPRDWRDTEYQTQRGYWDDFWLRHRSGAKTDPPVPEDALPRRGYFEVLIDGYDY